jgi:hypothetical protein
MDQKAGVEKLTGARMVHYKHYYGENHKICARSLFSIKCVLFFFHYSIIPNLFHSHKYLASHVRDVRRNTCKVQFILIQFHSEFERVNKI